MELSFHPESDLLELKRDERKPENQFNLIKTHMVEMNGFGVFGQLQQRGRSGHTMQPPVNQRMLNHSEMYTRRVHNDAVNDSLYESITKEGSFSGGNKMTFAFYEVFFNEDNSDPRKIYSQCKLDVSGVLIEGVADSVYAKVFADQLGYRGLSGKGFKRLLRFFNHRWVDDNDQERNDTDKVEVGDLAAFANLFEDVDLKSIDGFVAFLDRFKFKAFYPFYPTVDRTKSVYFHLERFGAMMRTVVPVAIDTMDGQHRANLLMLQSCGYFRPQGVMPMARCQSEGDQVHEGTQLWKRLKINVAQPFEPSDNLDELASDFVQFHQYGEKVNASQNYQIPTTFLNIWQKLEVVLEPHYNEGVEPLDWKNFWTKEKKCPGLVQTWTVMCEALKHRIIPVSDFSGKLKGSQCQTDPGEFLVEHEEKFVKLMMTCRNGGVKCAPPKCSWHLGFMIHYLRMTCHDRKAIPDMVALMSTNMGKVESLGITDLMMEHVHNFDWIIDNVLLPCKLVGEKYNVVLIAERYMIETGRKLFDKAAKKGDPFFDDYSQCESLIQKCKRTGDYSALVDLKPLAFAALLKVEKELEKGEKSYDRLVTLANLGMTSSPLTFKLHYVAQYALLVSALDVLRNFGPYPRLKIEVKNEDDLEVNWALREYLRQR